MKKFLIGIILMIFQLAPIYAQTLRVYFENKDYDEEVLGNHVALSDKALERRIMYGIELDERDLPVAESYISRIRELGAGVGAKSRWLNYIVTENVTAEQLKGFSFVKKVEPVGSSVRSTVTSTASSAEMQIEYGLATNQMSMVRGNILHEHGYLGEGMTIAVIDGGFTGTETSPVFDSLWGNGRILGSYNFEGKDTNVFQDGSHGSKVLSILGAYIDGIYSGSAPHANYWLLKSEVERSEYSIEMDYWLMAAEYADSVGADIITSSLGYNKFDDGEDDISYSDLDGNTTVVTRAADIAASKGILVITSAGNEGGGSWERITAPADGDSVLAVGAVDYQGNYASFSGTGPSADGRIKPDVVAQGVATAFAANDNNVYTGNGTSFSCPVISGLAACLWQVNRSKSNMDIYHKIRRSSNRWFTPNNNYGYGIPNFQYGFYEIGLDEVLEPSMINIFPNPVPDNESKLYISFAFPNEIDISLSLYDLSGRELYRRDIRSGKSGVEIDFPFAGGVYFLKMKLGENIFTYKILK